MVTPRNTGRRAKSSRGNVADTAAVLSKTVAATGYRRILMGPKIPYARNFVARERALVQVGLGTEQLARVRHRARQPGVLLIAVPGSQVDLGGAQHFEQAGGRRV